MIPEPKLSQGAEAMKLSAYFDGRRREIRTPDPLGVNDAAFNDFSSLSFCSPVNVRGTGEQHQAQSEPFLSHSLYMGRSCRLPLYYGRVG